MTHCEEQKAPHSGGPGRRKKERKQEAGSMTSSIADPSLFPRCVLLVTMQEQSCSRRPAQKTSCTVDSRRYRVGLLQGRVLRSPETCYRGLLSARFWSGCWLQAPMVWVLQGQTEDTGLGPPSSLCYSCPHSPFPFKACHPVFPRAVNPLFLVHSKLELPLP